MEEDYETLSGIVGMIVLRKTVLRMFRV
jgi:hypothetical protein